MRSWSTSALPDVLLLLLLAPVIGSFLGVLVRRLQQGRPIVMARSECERCGAVLRARDLIPVISYVALRGRCRRCAAPIGAFHPAMELGATAIALSALSVSSGAALWCGCVLGWMLMALAVYDWMHYRLPDVLTLPLLLLGLGATRLLWPDLLADHAVAAGLAYLAFQGLAWAYRCLQKRDGLGAGDAKLLAASGAWLGTGALPDVVLGAALLGLGLILMDVLRGRRISRLTRVPFGPCLAVSTWVMWLYG